MLCISTSERVIGMPYAGQNQLFLPKRHVFLLIFAFLIFVMEKDGIFFNQMI